MSKVAIVGAGLIGRAWALVFARAGWQVALYDPDETVRANLQDALSEDCKVLVKERLAADASFLDLITVVPSIAAAVENVDFVQENGPEDADIKAAIFREIEAGAPDDAVLASSTSAIVASRFTRDLETRARCLVGHPVNPPHLVPLVEICGSDWTSDEAMERAREIYASVGQVPITVREEIDGFVLNRLQGALLAEAFRLVRDGVVSVEDLDKTVRDGLGLRWSFMGPFETIDLNAPGGIADYCDRYLGFYRKLTGDPPGPEVFGLDSKQAIEKSWPVQPSPERLHVATERRNLRLAALRTHKAEREQAEIAAKGAKK